jgi:IS5 family transposase
MKIPDLKKAILADGIACELRHFVELGRRVVDQAQRRVIGGESVPVDEKLVSIFETHTDILVKGRRQVEYGHKICLAAGSSCLILDCQITDGNPADSKLATGMIERHVEHFGRAPRQVAFDGGFASKDNVASIKKLGVQDVAFSKRCGIEITDMVKSSWVYRRLRDFRAGVEGIISFFKRCFGGSRCTWRGLSSFKTYVWGSVVSCNLLVLARHRIAAA